MACPRHSKLGPISRTQSESSNLRTRHQAPISRCHSQALSSGSEPRDLFAGHDFRTHPRNLSQGPHLKGPTSEHTFRAPFRALYSGSYFRDPALGTSSQGANPRPYLQDAVLKTYLQDTNSRPTLGANL